MSVNVLGLSGEKIYILKKSKFDDQRTANLLLIANDERKQYATIKSLSQLLGSSNSSNGH